MGISAPRVYCKAEWGLAAVGMGARQVLRATGGAPCVCDVSGAGLSCQGAALGALPSAHRELS